MKHVVIGTAGHVDHGKTLLVKALTGIDTDRLAEEKIRQYFDESRGYLDRISVSPERKQVLREYTERMMNRKK